MPKHKSKLAREDALLTAKKQRELRRLLNHRGNKKPMPGCRSPNPKGRKRALPPMLELLERSTSQGSFSRDLLLKGWVCQGDALPGMPNGTIYWPTLRRKFSKTTPQGREVVRKLAFRLCRKTRKTLRQTDP